MWEGLGVVKTGRVMLGETDPVSVILGLADNFFKFIFIEMTYFRIYVSYQYFLSIFLLHPLLSTYYLKYFFGVFQSKFP